MRLLRQLAPCKGRIEFTCVWDRSFASGYSPPRTEALLGTAQFPLATRLLHVTGGLRLALVGFMVSSAYVALTLRVRSCARGLPRSRPTAKSVFPFAEHIAHHAERDGYYQR